MEKKVSEEEGVLFISIQTPFKQDNINNNKYPLPISPTLSSIYFIKKDMHGTLVSGRMTHDVSSSFYRMT